MQVILLERIRKLGQMGDIVEVKPGYARNFLLPQGKALRATKENLKRFERERAQLEARNLELKSEATAVAEKLEGKVFVIIRQAGDTGQLYGSVTTRDIAETVTEEGFTIKRNQVLLTRPIKVLGLHQVTLSLHPEVQVDVTINVARTHDEAERQAKGEDVLAVEEETGLTEETLDHEDVFESPELAQELAEDTEGETEGEGEEETAQAEPASSAEDTETR